MPRDVTNWSLLLPHADVFSPRPVPAWIGYDDPQAALSQAGGVPGGDEGPLLVVVNDPDRATDTVSALRALRRAAPRRRLSILVATGSHVFDEAARARHEAPLRAVMGDVCPIDWHDALAGPFAEVGGVRVSAAVAAARDVVGIGSVEPHWFAGLTGAHKTLSVGVMARGDIESNHVHALDEGADPFVVDGNPVLERLLGVLDAVTEGRRVLALQHVHERWVAGAPRAALAAAAGAARHRWLHTVDTPYDLLVAVVEAPLDRTLYQAEKGLKNNEHAVRAGGTLVIDAPLSGGVGPRRFVDLLRDAPDAETAASLIAMQGYRLGDHKAVRWRRLQARGVRLRVTGRLDADTLRVTGLSTFDPDAATGRVAVVRDAAHTVVRPR